MKDRPTPELLLEYVRSGLEEQSHYGFIKLLDRNGIICEIGQDNSCTFYQRSCAKPLQASLLEDNEIIDYFDLSGEEIAISCASHTGTLEHTNVLENYLTKIGCKKSHLQCGYHKPIDKKAKEELLISGQSEDILQNNCSGKHTFMLAYCKKENLDISNYPDVLHPLQQAIYTKLKSLCEAKTELKVTKDGCGVPIWATSLEELGRGYLNLFCNEKYKRIKNAFLNHPYLIGGHERLDSEIINASDNLVAKVGAGGLCVVVNLDKQQALVVKVSDAELTARSIITIKVLLQLGWLKENALNLKGLQSIYSPKIQTLHKEIIGTIDVCFDLSSIKH